VKRSHIPLRNKFYLLGEICGRFEKAGHTVKDCMTLLLGQKVQRRTPAHAPTLGLLKKCKGQHLHMLLHLAKEEEEEK
jgi:hypothetical protein